MARNTPLSSADARLQKYLPDDVKLSEATWLHKQSGMNIVKHRYLKQIAGLQQIRVVPESVKLDFFAERNKSICFVMVETKDKQTYCSVAEADPANNKNAYPAMMAYKRAVDRAILEALNLQGFFYSEAEIALTDSEAEEAQRRSDNALKEPEQTSKAEEVKAQLEGVSTNDRTANDFIDALKHQETKEKLKSYLKEIAQADDFKKLTTEETATIRNLASLVMNSFNPQVQAAE